jgi:flavin reductase (DIM6/NTAB) family NADH-FMN oxidoreductase RutF
MNYMHVAATLKSKKRKVWPAPMDPLYLMLRHLTSPVVAITTSAEGCKNGMIANSAQRASLVPSVPRVSVYISKTNVSHDLIYRSGVFGMHLLRADQWELIWRLGLKSAREVPHKLEGLKVRTGTTGCPLLVDILAALECRVANAMDTGASTLFLGDVISVEKGREGAVMTSKHFRTHLPPDMQAIYEARLKAAQGALEQLARKIEPGLQWPGPQVTP